MALDVKHNEQLAELAFSMQAQVFDKLYSYDTIVNYKRDRVRSHMLPGCSSN